MGFEYPGAFVWSVAALGVVVLYLWRTAGRPEPVATFALWQRALARRSLASRLRPALSAALHVLALLLLVLALAGPYRLEQAARRRSLVLVLDTSASMLAADVRPSRFDLLREQAALLIDDLRGEDRLAILAAGTPLRILTRLGEPVAAQHAAWAALESPSGPPRVAEAVRMARAILQDQPNPEIVVLTDGAFEQAAELAAEPDVRLVLLTGQPHHAAITRLAARPMPFEPGRYAVLVEVTNQGLQPIHGQLTIGIEGAESWTLPVELAVGQRLGRLATVSSEEPARVAAQLRYDGGEDGDRVSLPLDGWQPLPVHVIGEPTAVRSAIREALEAVAGTAVETWDDFSAVGDEQAVYVFHRRVPPQLPPGGVLVLDPDTDCDLWQVGEPRLGPLQARPVGSEHVPRAGEESVGRQLLRGVRIAETVFERAATLEYAVPVRLLAGFETGEPLYTRLERPAGPVLVWQSGWERETSDLLLRDDYRDLLRNAVRHLGDELATVCADRSGVPRLLAPPGVAGQALPLRGAPRRRPLWFWLAAAAALLLAVEGCLFHRNLTV